jgi:phosphopentomutase
VKECIRNFDEQLAKVQNDLKSLDEMVIATHGLTPTDEDDIEETEKVIRLYEIFFKIYQ